MRSIIFKIFLIILPIIFLPLLIRKSNGKDYLPISNCISYLGNYSNDNYFLDMFKDDIQDIKNIVDDGYNFLDGLKLVANVTTASIEIMLIPVEIVFYYLNFIPFYINA